MQDAAASHADAGVACVLCCAVCWCCVPLCAQTAARPSDTEALRLLGESRLLNAEPAKSVAAYEKAISLAPNDQSVITVRMGLELTDSID